MLYFKKNSNTIIFSDKHYREEALLHLKALDIALENKLLVSTDPKLPPFLSVPYDKYENRAILKQKCFEYGVKEDHTEEKWKAACVEQCVEQKEVKEEFSVDNYVDRIVSKSIEEFADNCVYGENSYLQQYVKDTCRTECDYEGTLKRLSSRNFISLLHGAIGICTEAGELQDQLKRHIFYGKELDKVNIEEELGDICWYIAIICNAMGFDWEEILKKNINKLKARFPNKFTEEHAINRNLDAERKVLEEVK